MNVTIIGCGDLHLPVGCCSSCHEDADEHGILLCGIRNDIEGYDVEVCCAVATELDRMGKDATRRVIETAVKERAERLAVGA